jgi:alanine racemase
MSMIPYRSWVEVSRAQIARNFRVVAGAVGSEVEVMPVVKADAYRHGAIEVSRVLIDEGARWLAVSNVEEGVALRQTTAPLLPSGESTRILVMADFLPVGRLAMLEYGLTPVLHSLDDLRELDRLAELRGVPVDYHLKIDSGMGRLGTRATAEKVCEAIRAATHARLEGLMTHFASSADYMSLQTDEQTAYFAKMCAYLDKAGIRPRYLHMSSTNPIAFGRREAWRNMVRPGHAIYGYLSGGRGKAPAAILDVAPALTWKAAVLTVKDLPEGVRVGYGGMYRTPHPMRIAVLAVGYADGYPHRLSNHGQVIVRGKFANVLGAVSMDVTTVDVSHAPDLQPGDAVTLLGREGEASIDAQQIARVAGTISYSILCGIHARVKRVYV